MEKQFSYKAQRSESTNSLAVERPQKGAEQMTDLVLDIQAIKAFAQRLYGALDTVLVENIAITETFSNDKRGWVKRRSPLRVTLFGIVPKGLEKVQLRIPTLHGGNRHPDFSINEITKPFTWEAGDMVRVYANQGYRPGTILAVLGDEALVEYEMPQGTTTLWVIDAHRAVPCKIRNLSYKRCPKKWKAALKESEMEWEGNPQNR
jgi:hypothetical protein